MDNLSGFDPSTMTYLATQMQHPNAQASQELFDDMLLPGTFSEQRSAYGGYHGYVPCRPPPYPPPFANRVRN
jgi:hypothetical protein